MRGWPVVLLVMLTSCARCAQDPAAREEAGAATGASVAQPAPTLPLVPVVVPPSGPPAAPVIKPYGDTERDVQARCPSREHAACARKLADTEVTAAIAPASTRDPLRHAALTQDQLDWARWVDDLCAFLAPDGGTAPCLERAAIERVHYARSLAADDAAALALRVRERSVAGEKVRKMLDARQESDLARRGTKLARTACAWAALADAVGGVTACPTELARYYAGVVDP